MIEKLEDALTPAFPPVTIDRAMIDERDVGPERRDGWPTTISPLGGIPAPSKQRLAVVAKPLQLLEPLASRVKRCCAAAMAAMAASNITW